MPTCDGINDNDWEAVIELAAEIANISERGADTGLIERQLLKKLDLLEKNYGRLPSILSIRAHYINDREIKLSLLKEAYITACENSDARNKIFISSEITELYIEEFNDLARARYWVNILKNNLDDYPEDKDDQDLYLELLGKVS